MGSCIIFIIRFNYSSLETFLQSIPDVCRITFKGKDIYVVGVASAETQHIEKLVQKQGGKAGGGGARRGAKPRADEWKKFYPGASAVQNNISRKATTSEKSSSSKSSKSVTNGIGSMKIETKRAPAPVRIVPKRVSTQSHVNGNCAAQSPGVITVTKESIKTWTARVKKLLDGRPHGLMKTQVEKFYEKQWDEKLPHQWADVMLEDEIIVMKRESNQSNYIVTLKSLSSQSTTTQTSDTSVVIPGGGYPSGSHWTVTITNVVSTSHLWVMFGEAPLKLEALQRVMEMRHRAGQSFSGGRMPPGNYFSAKLDSGEYVRVKVSKVDRMNNSCHCFLVDYGKEMKIDWGQLTNLHKDFLTLPTMALKVILSGVEDSKAPELVEYVRNKLVGSKLRAIEVKNGVNNIPIIHLLDGDDVVQEDLVKQFKKLSRAAEQATINNNCYSVPNRNGGGMMSSLSSPSLPGVGEFYDLKISHIVTLGEMYAQSYTSLAKYAVMTQNMNRHYEREGSRCGVSTVHPGMLVAVKRTGDWRRAQVIVEIDAPSKNCDSEVIVKLMDSGEAITVNLKEIKQLDERFAELPLQVEHY